MLLFEMPTPAQGESGFLRSSGKADIVLSYHDDDFPERIDLGLGNSADGRVRRESWSLYAAYGLTDSVDLTLNGSYAKASGRGAVPDPNERDWQDIVFSAKLRVREWDVGETVFSFLLAPGIKLPITDYETYSFNALGSAQVDLRARVIGHVQGSRGGWFASIETGYDRRNGSPNDELPLNITLGANPGRLVWITPFYSRSFRRGGSSGKTGVFSGDEDFRRYGVGIYVPVHEHVGLVASWRRSSDGRERGDIDGYSLGIVIKL